MKSGLDKLLGFVRSGAVFFFFLCSFLENLQCHGSGASAAALGHGELGGKSRVELERRKMLVHRFQSRSLDHLVFCLW